MAAWTPLYTATATIGTTEYSITLASTSGVPASKTDKVTAQVWLDTNALAAGDEFLLQLYDKVVSGGTQRLVDSWTLVKSAKPIIVEIPYMIGEGWDFTLKKIAGTDRSIVASVRAYQ